MQISRYYFNILGVKPSATIEDIKKAFRTLVRKNHPDVFPEDQKEFQELKMIQINEAYARLTESLDGMHGRDQKIEEYEFDKKIFRNQEKIQKVPSMQNAVGFHRDIQYAYYKQGFDNFSKAVNGMRSMEWRVRLRNDMYYLRRFSSSLVFLRKADMYFSKLVNNYPESIWSYDAYIKIKRIEYFNMIYKKILSNIESKLKKKSERQEKGKFT
jgi:curved DNA-binding protein CbpA